MTPNTGSKGALLNNVCISKTSQFTMSSGSVVQHDDCEVFSYTRGSD